MVIKSLKVPSLFFILSLSVFLGCDEESKTVKKRPNILWISVEDISPDLGCYGDPIAHTPTLDKLASNGFMYTNAIANAPVCAPAKDHVALKTTHFKAGKIYNNTR